MSLSDSPGDQLVKVEGQPTKSGDNYNTYNLFFFVREFSLEDQKGKKNL